MMSMTVGFK